MDFLFRGLDNSAWPLATTLERAGREGMAASAHYATVSRAHPQIESFTRTKWAIRLPPDVDTWLRRGGAWDALRFPTQEEYSYMVHLRHHGFPSPLLDWTRSPYIAAFFAFRSETGPPGGNVSICVFSETPCQCKSRRNGEPQIRRMGPYVTTHRRHFLQQSDYTMCGIFKKKWHFAKHEDVFVNGNPNQHVLWRFNIPWIPWTERLKVLKLLDSYSLNAFSLFGSEESLMETLAFRELGSRGEGS